MLLLTAIVAAGLAVPTPSPTISPLPSRVVQWYARRGALASGLDVSLVRAVIDAESGGDPSAVSKAGAIGMMQLLSDTASDCGIHDRFDPSDNVDCGSRTLAYLVHRYGIESGIAAYNFGAGNVESAGGHFSKLPQETQTYVKNVVEEYDELQHESLEAQAPQMHSPYAIDSSAPALLQAEAALVVDPLARMPACSELEMPRLFRGISYTGAVDED